MKQGNKHKNYDTLNLIGYGLSKFGEDFIKCFGFNTKTDFYKYIVNQNVAERTSIVKNREDLFDPFFPNKKKGWHQKGDAYIHRKILIDSLFSDFGVNAYAEMLKLHLHDKFDTDIDASVTKNPIVKTKFKQLQLTGHAAELFFENNYQQISYFQNGDLEDARMFGDGYDFQITVANHFFLAEIKGVREKSGSIRITENEYSKAKEYKNRYALIVVSELRENPKMNTIFNPLKGINFTKKETDSRQTNYHTKSLTW